MFDKIGIGSVRTSDNEILSIAVNFSAEIQKFIETTDFDSKKDTVITRPVTYSHFPGNVSDGGEDDNPPPESEGNDVTIYISD